MVSSLKVRDALSLRRSASSVRQVTRVAIIRSMSVMLSRQSACRNLPPLTLNPHLWDRNKSKVNALRPNSYPCGRGRIDARNGLTSAAMWP